MSFFDEASWVLIPEGIEEDIVFAQKPTNGLGDLTFTRASDATRTNSAGVIERTPWNLLVWSEMFSDVAWTKSNATIGVNTATAPNGTLTADSLIGNGLSSPHATSQSISLVTGVNYNLSFYAKAGTNNFIQITAATGAFGSTFFANFDLSNGTLGSFGGAAISPSIESVGDGWYRCSVSGVSLTTSSVAAFALYLVTSGTSARLETNTLSTNVFIWGAQVVEGTDAKPYFATTNRQDVPRLDYRNADGSVSTCPRLLLEPQRTNSIRNSTMVGAVAGSPGTIPTNWGGGSGGLTRTVVGLGTENGLSYIDVRFNGTANSTVATFTFETNGGITASVGQVWSNNVYVKNIDTTAQANQVLLTTYEFNLIGTYLAEGSVNIRSQLTTSLKRFDFVRTLTSATVARVQPLLQFILTNGATYDFTIRIAAPQMELGAYATTFIPTTTAAVTRLADVASKTGVSSLIGQTEGTLFVDIIPTDVTTTNAIGINSASTTGRVIIFTGGNLIFGQVRVGAVTQFSVNTSATVGVRYKAAIAYKQNDFAFYVNGAQIAVSNTGTVPACSVISYDAGGAISPFLGRNNQAALFPTRLTNAQLAQLTTL